MSGFLIILILLAGFWLVAVMPRRRRLRAHQNMQDSLGVGDDVITAGGLHGRVHELGNGEVRLEIAPDVVVTVDRRAVAAVATEVEVEAEAEAGEDGLPEHEPETGPAAENPR